MGDYEELQNRIASLVYATNYRSLGFLFLSYIAVNKELAKDLSRAGAHNIVADIRHNAAKRLLEEIARKANWSNGIIAEIEKKNEKKNASLRRRFSFYAKEFFERHLFHIDINYFQPALDANHLDSLEAQDLLLIPGDAISEKIHNEQLPREEIVKILEFVYFRLYGETFDGTEHETTYRSYIKSVFDLVCEPLKDKDMVPVKLIRP